MSLMITKNDVGKRFRRRDGTVVTITKWDDNYDDFPVFAGGESYLADGYCWHDHWRSPYDLVERVEDKPKRSKRVVAGKGYKVNNTPNLSDFDESEEYFRAQAAAEPKELRWNNVYPDALLDIEQDDLLNRDTMLDEFFPPRYHKAIVTVLGEITQAPKELWLLVRYWYRILTNLKKYLRRRNFFRIIERNQTQSK